MTIHGSCLCGAVRYRPEGPPLHAGYCHRRMCQRAAGAEDPSWPTLTCRVDGAAAVAWLERHRPGVARQGREAT